MIKEVKELCKEYKERRINLIEKFNNEKFECRSDQAVFKKRLNLDLQIIDSFINGLITASEIYQKSSPNLNKESLK